MSGRAHPSRTKAEARRRLLSLLAVSLFLFSPAIAHAQESLPQLVEVYWQGSKTLPVLGVTGVTVLDDSICHAQALEDKIQFVGLARGETIAFVWIKDQRFTVRISVVAPPEKALPPRLSQHALDALGNGVIGSSMQTFIDPQGNTDYLLLHHVDWQQQFDKNRLSIHGQAQDSTFAGSPRFNANTLSIQYSTPRSNFQFADFPLFVNGGLETKVSPYSTYNVYMIRGADVTLKRGANQYEFFGGTTIPPFYLTLSGTRDVAGLNFSRKHSDELYFYGTTGWVNSPFQVSPTLMQRDNSFFQTAGLVYRPSRGWAVQGSVGGSTEGGLAQGTVSYTGERLTGFVSGTSSSANFPLNQLQLFFAGGSSVSAGATLRMNSQIAGSLYFQHSVTKTTGFFPVGGTSDYLNPNLTLALTPRESLTLNYTYTRNSAGGKLLGRNQGHRLDVAVNSRLGAGYSNTAEITSGALSDPLQLNAAGQFSLQDSLSIPLRGNFLTVNVQHTRSDPSLVNRLNQELGLLSPALQQLFLMDPLTFVNSPELDPEIRALLQNLQPNDTEISVTGQFRLRDKLNLSPNVGWTRNAAGLGRTTDTKLYGYTLSYQATPSWQLTSSLSNVYLIAPMQNGARRTTVLTVGFNKSLRGTGQWLLPFHQQKRAIRGRVFRDLNVNGTYSAGKPGLANVRVDLNTGESVRTDSQGFFEFSGLHPDTYRVTVPLSQFTQAVRVTTPTEVRVELVEEKLAEVNFGIVNFARVMGTVFNDYRMNGVKQIDANGVRAIRLTLTGEGVSRKMVCDGGGDFEVYEVPPGDYQLTIDRSTLPPNYVASTKATSIHVEPTSTVVRDMPVEALRSVSGHVYFKPASGSASSSNERQGEKPGSGSSNPNVIAEAGAAPLQPLAGVQLTIDDTTATTGADGSFVLRNLPAGNLTLTLVPTRPLPPGLAVPAGRMKLPREPIQVENATIVISNPELVKYITPVVAEAK